MPWANTVARAAPDASKCIPATNTKFPMTLTIQATPTNSSGDLLSPNPLNIADKIL